jgi:hypothetical protein
VEENGSSDTISNKKQAAGITHHVPHTRPPSSLSIFEEWTSQIAKKHQHSSTIKSIASRSTLFFLSSSKGKSQSPGDALEAIVES